MWKVQLAENYGKSEKTHKIMKIRRFYTKNLSLYIYHHKFWNAPFPTETSLSWNSRWCLRCFNISIVFYFWKKYYVNCFSVPQHLNRYLECINDIIGKITGNSYFKNRRYLFYWVSRFRWFNVLFQNRSLQDFLNLNRINDCFWLEILFNRLKHFQNY